MSNQGGYSGYEGHYGRFQDRDAQGRFTETRGRQAGRYEDDDARGDARSYRHESYGYGARARDEEGRFVSQRESHRGNLWRYDDDEGHHPHRSMNVPRYQGETERGDESRSGGRWREYPSRENQVRYGQYSGDRGYGRYDEEDDDRRSGYRRGGSSMQPRDEQGHFVGAGEWRSRSRYDEDDDDDRRSSYRRGGGFRSQPRDEQGHFVGYGEGRPHSRYDDDEDAQFGGWRGRSMGGRHSAEMQDRDEQGHFAGYGGRSRSRSRQDDDYDDYNDAWRGGYRPYARYSSRG